MNRLHVAAVAGFVGALLASRPVLARPPEPTIPAPPAAPRGQTHVPPWYGWEIILLDGVSLATLEAGDVGYSAPLIVLGGVSYLALGPIVHAGNGRSDRVASSLLLRFAAPVVAVMAGIVVSQACFRDDPSAKTVGPSSQHVWTCSIGEKTAFYSVILGPIVAVSLFDAIRASRLPQEPVASSPASATRVAWLPTIAPTVVGAGATVGLVGAF